MTEIWLVIHKDRHFGVDVQAYSTWDAANNELEKVVAEYGRHPEAIEKYGDPVERGVTYSCESDYVEIVRREVDAPAEAKSEAWVVSAVLDGERHRRYEWPTEEAARDHVGALCGLTYFPATDVKYRREWAAPWVQVKP